MAAPDVARMYARVAGVYDAWTRFTERRSLEAAVAAAGIEDGSSVLEVAVGTGVAFREVLERNPGGRNVGVDLTEAMLERARRKARASGIRHELLQADATALPFPDGSFDVVLNNNMLGVVDSGLVAPIVSEIQRVLRPSGRLVIVMMRRPANALSLAVYQIGAVWLGGWKDVDVAAALRDAGFVDIQRTTVTQLGIPSDVIVATKAPGDR
jgi:ubiquinone/menaquinone biosynthesis C-methylase UbiE